MLTSAVFSAVVAVIVLPMMRYSAYSTPILVITRITVYLIADIDVVSVVVILLKNNRLLAMSAASYSPRLAVGSLTIVRCPVNHLSRQFIVISSKIRQCVEI